jgi:hypothetical protein
MRRADDDWLDMLRGFCLGNAFDLGETRQGGRHVAYLSSAFSCLLLLISSVLIRAPRGMIPHAEPAARRRKRICNISAL